jgi:3'(2'), 5'-bisphosphate nucleotidase
MTFASHAKFAEALLPALCEAARVIVKTREAGLIVDRKSDESPVTDADRRAEVLLTAALNKLEPNIPVVAEESASAGSTPVVGSTFFLLDPLDGTREYAAGRDDFTINIALIDDGRPVFGLLYAPAGHDLFLTRGPGDAVAARLDWHAAPTTLADLDPVRVSVNRIPATALTALVSRREAGPEFEDRLTALGVAKRIGMSSAIKFGLVARGDADIYPRFGPTYEWDTAAGHAIVDAAGGTVTTLDGDPLIYGKVSDSFLNGPFVARGRQ